MELLRRGKHYWVSAGRLENVPEGTGTLYRQVISSQWNQSREGLRRLEKGEHKALVRRGWGEGESK